ncbi:MAG: filamentous hemagglutinin family protein [Methylovulum sp.]|nr:filamentous hemagglutinin family protein [Methylovulum sp.]
MGNKQSVAQYINTMDIFRLRPLSACVRMAIAGSVFWGPVLPVYAELPIPAQVWASMNPVTNQPAATNQVVGDTLRIDQQTDRVILNWESFNVGAKNQVQFNQPSSSSIALNRIFQESPSQILGKVTANGQIYLYNQNGFVFGKDSVVDVNTLVASTLNVSDKIFENGIVREFDDSGNAAFEGSTANPKAAIQVDAGADIHIGKNGRLIMAAPDVSNAGSISADEQGQIILVASKDKVYLQPADNSGPFAGLLVEVGSGGKVSNLGNIMSRQGNVTLAGFAVNQGGRVTATTSVSVNGSIRLLAREAAEKQNEVLVATTSNRNKDAGDHLGTESQVTFAPGSVTQIVADTSGGSAIDEQDQPTSYLEVSANTVHMQAGSLVDAAAGKIDITATDNLLDPVQGSKGRIILDKEARIDVSGIKHVEASVARNVVEMPVQTYELRDSPLQKGGVLQGQTVQVDIRKDTKIIDTSGAKARFERGIDERLGVGGEINLTSSGDVIVNNEAVVNISGGSIDYQEGYISTTKLLTDYGKIVDISDADPDERYAAIYGVVKEVYEKWGPDATEVWDSQAQLGQGRFEQGYTQGLAAGALNIVTPKVSWNGDLVAGSANNIYQRTADTIAFGGSFSLDTTEFLSAQSVVFQAEKNAVNIAVDEEFPKDKQNKPDNLILPTALSNDSGIQKLIIKTLDSVTVGADANIAMQAGGQFILDTGKIDVQGDIYSSGGAINLISRNTGVPENSGKIDLSPESVLDVSGRWVNDFAQGLDATPTEPLAIDGGSISVTATGDLNLNAGAVVSADGGAWLALNNRLVEGKGGSISLVTTPRADNGSSLLHLDGELSAYGLSEGGSLSLSSGEVIVGVAGDAVKAASALVLGVHDGHFDFDKKSGFSNINLTSSSGDISVKADAPLALIQQNRILEGDFGQRASGKSLADFSRIETLPEHLRSPVNLTLKSLSKDVKLETGSKIVADKEASISLAATVGSIYADGLIDAPAGSIKLGINADPGVEYDAAQAIWLGGHASLQAAGATRMNPIDATGRRTGEVLDGGDVTLKAQRGYVITEQGSQINVSGTRSVLDLPVNDSSATRFHFAPAEIGSNAGTVALMAAEGAVLDGSLKGSAGSQATLGGRIDLALDRTQRNPPDPAIIPFPAGDLVVNVMQADQARLDNTTQFGKVIPEALNGQMRVSADKITVGGFSDVRLSSNNEVSFLGDVNLATQGRIDIDAPVIAWSGLDDVAAGAVNLDTAYLRVGSSLIREVDTMPVAGSGTFTAQSQWTELGGASLWNGFSGINLNSGHDLRTVGLVNISAEHRDYVGTMVTAADLNLTASQVYPATLTHFTFAVKNNPEGQITLSGNANKDAPPLSSAGILNFEAPIINQNGVVKAPFGTINLTAGSSLTLGESSLTSVSGNGQLIPFGVIQGGLDWLYPLDSNHNLVFSTPPEKKLVLSAPTVSVAKGGVVDLSGGGDLLAYEFLPGSGGSYDYLDQTSPSYQGGFAVVPTLGTDIAPYDPLQSAGFDYAIGSKIYLRGTLGLPAGEYTILPARYALLPGAYLVTPQANTQDVVLTTYTKAGLPVVPGIQTIAGTGARDARWSGYLVESGSDIRKHSEYDEQKANAFFVSQALKNGTSTPVLPIDSGQVSIAAQDKLDLQGEFKVASSGGRGARMDIAANRLKVVKNLSTTPTEGILEVLADDLSLLGVDSLFLGGGRTNNVATGATDLNITSGEVVFDTDSRVQVTDLVAAATDKVEVRSGAVLTADGNVNTGDTLFNMTGDGALLRVSSDNQVTLNRLSGLGNTGELLIQEGATLAASKSMLLDASKSTTLTGNIQMKGGALNLSANAINIGEVNGLSDGALNLSNEKLLSLAVDELVLSSRDTVNLYGNVGQADSSGNLSAIKFDSLVINAAGLSGFGAAGQTAKLEANTLQLQNTLGATTLRPATGLGVLDVLAKNYMQGSGSFGVNGFHTINLNAEEAFQADGEGLLNVGGDLNLAAGYLTAGGGSHLRVDAGGHNIQVNGNGSSANPVANNLGGAVNLKADAIDFNARVLMPSGSLGLQSLSGDVNVGGQADINLAGLAVNFADTVDYAPGGTFSAVADHGKIKLAEGSVVDLSTGGDSAKGGELVLNALEQTVDLSGQIKATAGSAELDVAKFSANADFDSLMNKLKDAGISDSIYFRTRAADIVQSSDQVIKANAVALVADKGEIALSGKIDANGSTAGGDIRLYAGDKVTLENGAVLEAMGSKGGKAMLSSVDNDSDNISGINVKTGALIDVSGDTEEAGGEVTLRALRVDGSVNIQPIAGTVQGYAQKAAIVVDNGDLVFQGYSKFYAEGVKKYSNDYFTVAGEINGNDINNIKNDTDVTLSADNIKKINSELGAGISLRAGVEIDYAGDLALNSRWDLVDWRYGGSTNANPMPGTLTINTSGKLTLNSSLTDGFKDDTLYFGTVHVADMLQTGDSWSYKITAGADLGSAESGATAAAKDLTLGSNVTVRTGTGDIQLGAGGDIIFTDQTSTVYNAGRAENTARYGTLSDITVGFLLYGEYPVDGGDLVIKAGNNIEGAVSDQFIDSWLLRFGSWANDTTHANQRPTAWGVALGYTTDGYGNAADAKAPLFQQNVGSFGGGKVNVSASGNINDLSVMLPTTGKQIGERSPTSDSDYLTNVVQIQGGGDMQVDAGENITGGAYFLGKGAGVISAGAAIAGSARQFVNGPQLVMGDSNLNLNAKSGISVTGISDAMVLHSGNRYAEDGSNFFSYTDTSGIALKSLSGDIHLGADTSIIGATDMLSLTGSQASLSKIYPASLQTTAFGGSVSLDSQVTLFPSPSSTLTVLAKNNITSTLDSLRLSMSDADRILLPSSTFPLARNQLNDAEAILNPFGINDLVHAAIPVHTNDEGPVRLVTNDGDIKSIQINVPKKAIIQSGNDINNVLINIQHVNDGDVSVVSANRDIRFTSARSVDGLLVDNFNEIKIAGPGDVLVKAGRDIDFGASRGLSTIGNLANSNLSSDVGANIAVLAGLNPHDTPNYLGVLNLDPYIVKYAENYIKFQQLVTEFMRGRTGDTALVEKKAVEAFKALDPKEYAALQPKLDALISPKYSDIFKNITGFVTEYVKYAENNSKFQQLVTEFMRGRTGNSALTKKVALEGFRRLDKNDYGDIQPNLDALVSTKYISDPALTDAKALEIFANLSPDQYLSIQPQLNTLVNSVFFSELKATGAASASNPESGNERGFAVIDALFPENQWKGNLSLFFSKLQTLQGGNIDLLVPGGEINAGLAVSFSGAKEASELGIVAQGKGDINAFVDDDFIVNQSRVFALSSGDILIWSSEGDIDAGRGAKSAIAAPPPEYDFDTNGNLVVTFPPIVSGSGIRTAATIGNTPGDVFLFAPKGVVNAGEAGIGGTNVTISATAVLGANNIQIGPGGSGSGVPVGSSGGLAAGLTGASNLGASVSQVAQASADMSKDSKDNDNKSMKLGVLSVEVIGYGDGSAEENTKKNKPKSAL